MRSRGRQRLRALRRPIRKLPAQRLAANAHLAAGSRFSDSLDILTEKQAFFQEPRQYFFPVCRSAVLSARAVPWLAELEAASVDIRRVLQLLERRGFQAVHRPQRSASAH